MNSFLDHLTHAFDLPLSNPVLIFAIILFIILMSPILLSKLRIPGIIGLIISGVIIGPHGLGWLEKNSAVELFSTVGLLYIMFIVGMELDIAGFKKNKNKSIVFGFLTFIIPMGLGFPVCYYLLEIPWNASLLTASMFATHTLVAYPIISKFGISRTETVIITVGGTILTDTAVLILLAVIVGTEQGGIGSDFWIGLGISLAVFSLIMFVIVPRIARWFFTKLESERTSHFVFVLAVVFFSAFLAEISGLEPIIGAFIAGLALNPLIPHSSVLMNRLEFVGNAIFIPFFLISVGMLVDLSVLLNGPAALLIAFVLTFVAILSKYLAATVFAKIYSFSKLQAQLIFGLSNARAAATLSVILVGYRIGIIDDNILNSTVVLILVTCIVSSFVTESASKKIVQEQEAPEHKPVPEADNLNEHLLLPVANFNNVESLLELSMFLKNKSSKYPITLLSVVNNDLQAEQNIAQVKKKLESSLALATANEVKVQTIATIDYNIASGIIRTAKEVQANIIILGWPTKTSLIDRFFGPKTENIVARTDKNIFITHIINPLNTYRRLLVFLPPFVEREKGFDLILNKVFSISSEFSLKVLIYGVSRTAASVKYFINENKISTEATFEIIGGVGNFIHLADEITNDDILIVVGARKNTASYSGYMESIPRRLDRHFSENSVLLIYPQVDGIELENQSIGTTI